MAWPGRAADARRRAVGVPRPQAADHHAGASPRPPDLVGRQFLAARPDRLWVADLTYVRSFQGCVYVAFVLDAFRRMIVGSQLANHLWTDPTLDAREMVLWGRQGQLGRGQLVHHSDAGCQNIRRSGLGRTTWLLDAWSHGINCDQR
jgi:putative transposase